MAQTQTLEKEKPLWNPGKMGGIEFISSIKRLEKELPELHKVIELREGFEVDFEGYHYRVGANKYGLWLSRRKLGSE